jgi:hypothetical protein
MVTVRIEILRTNKKKIPIHNYFLKVKTKNIGDRTLHMTLLTS